MTLIAHAATGATREARFAREDEAAEAAGLGEAARMAGAIGRVDRGWTSPAAAARRTADALGIAAAVEPALGDLDAGAWVGRSLDEVGAADPEGIARWLADPSAAPHGGETVAALVGRVGRWLGEVGREGRVVAVTHAAVVRAAVVVALEAPARAFWRIDVAPLGVTVLSGRGAGWTVGMVNGRR